MVKLLVAVDDGEVVTDVVALEVAVVVGLLVCELVADDVTLVVAVEVADVVVVPVWDVVGDVVWDVVRDVVTDVVAVPVELLVTDEVTVLVALVVWLLLGVEVTVDVIELVADVVGVIRSQLSNVPRACAVTAALRMATASEQPSLWRRKPSIEHSKLDVTVPTLKESTMWSIPGSRASHAPRKWRSHWLCSC